MRLIQILASCLSLCYCQCAVPLVMPDFTQKTFTYTFTVEWKLTMAWQNETSEMATLLTYDVDQASYMFKPSDQHLACNATELLPVWAESLPGVVTADGKHRRMIMLNGQIPAPTIVVPYGSDIVIKVSNMLASEGVTLHFHGMDKRDEWFMDGVAGLQQCPIMPGNDFTYQFTADTIGTHFYHGHLGSDRSEGVFGAVVVVPEQRQVTMEDARRVVPDVEYVLTLFDWNTVSGTELWYNHHWRTMKFLYGYENNDQCWRPTKTMDGTVIGGVYPFSAIIINDKGWYDQDDIRHRPYRLDLETFPVEEGEKSYLFRMINAGQSIGFIVSVEDHQIEVVATDGAPVRGVPVDFIILYPGERYDFLLISKKKAEKDVYYLIVETMEYYDFYWNRIDPFYGLAKIQYKHSNSTEIPDVNHNRCTADQPCTVLNCPFPAFPPHSNRTCFNIDRLEYTGQVETEALQQSYQPGDPNFQEYFFNFHYDNVVNGWLFRYPKGPPYFYHGNEEAVMYPCTEENWKGTRNSWCTQTLNITLGGVVQLVLYTTGMGGDREEGFHHPIHLHGTHFYVVKTGYAVYNETDGLMIDSNTDIPCTDMQEECDGLSWVNRTWLHGNVPDMNLDQPVFKDTVILPVGGYVVLRFKADNPGWWVLHCHIMVHHMGGMAFALRIGEHQQMPKPPPNFPQCGVFEPTSSTAAHGVSDIVSIFVSAMLAWKLS